MPEKGPKEGNCQQFGSSEHTPFLRPPLVWGLSHFGGLPQSSAMPGSSATGHPSGYLASTTTVPVPAAVWQVCLQSAERRNMFWGPLGDGRKWSKRTQKDAKKTVILQKLWKQFIVPIPKCCAADTSLDSPNKWTRTIGTCELTLMYLLVGSKCMCIQERPSVVDDGAK